MCRADRADPDGLNVTSPTRGTGDDPPGTGGGNGRQVTFRQYCAYRLMIRNGEPLTLHRSCRLFQELVVDWQARCEGQRLLYLRNNQPRLRADTYSNVRAAHAGGRVAREVGTRVVLPATFTGGPRYMQQQYQDAMAIVRDRGNPSLFITMTCNSQWCEITNALLPGQHPNDRPDIVGRVFHLKLRNLLADLRTCFGRAVGLLAVVEWQKRGLPHAHILLILDPADRARTAADYDRFVCAELPDPDTEPVLHSLVARHMMHGPCGTMCHDIDRMPPCCTDSRGGSCSRFYPHDWQNVTRDNEDGYPIYRRRDTRAADGNRRAVRKQGVDLDSRWVVPYNRALLRRYNCHMNVEVASSIKSVKYLYKYVLKGHDRARAIVRTTAGAHGASVPPVTHTSRIDGLIGIGAAVVGVAAAVAAATAGGDDAAAGRVDEIAEYVDSRYVSASEAAWRLCDLDLTHRFPAVVRLQVHEAGGEGVRFDDDADLADVAARAPGSSTLTGWFALNAADTSPAGPRRLLYSEVPAHYTWQNRWVSRSVHASNHDRLRPVGRLYGASPSEGERYYLRLLLNHVRGAASYADLRTTQMDPAAAATIHSTYRAACVERGLLFGDEEWDRALTEAALTQVASRLRQLFSIILSECSPARPEALWADHGASMSEDILHARRVTAGDMSLPLSPDDTDEALRRLEGVLQATGKSLLDWPTMPLPSARPDDRTEAYDIAEQLAWDLPTLRRRVDSGVAALYPAQRAIYEAVMAAVEAMDGGVGEPAVFVVQALGGCGKTYLLNLLLDTVRLRSHIALACATSGVAALLLHGGTTAHYRFKIPIDLDDSSQCKITPGSQAGRLVGRTRLVTMDEAPMLHRHGHEALDRLFRDVRGAQHPAHNDVPYGGCVFVLAGDMHQTLPVVRKGTRAQTVAASFMMSPLWSVARIMHLDENMRVARLLSEGRDAGPQRAFADWLLSVGEGVDGPLLRLPPAIVAATPHVADLVDAVYGDLSQPANRLPGRLVDRCILAPLNKHVAHLNNDIHAAWPGAAVSYQSADEVCRPA